MLISPAQVRRTPHCNHWCNSSWVCVTNSSFFAPTHRFTCSLASSWTGGLHPMPTRHPCVHALHTDARRISLAMGTTSYSKRTHMRRGRVAAAASGHSAVLLHVDSSDSYMMRVPMCTLLAVAVASWVAAVNTSRMTRLIISTTRPQFPIQKEHHTVLAKILLVPGSMQKNIRIEFCEIKQSHGDLHEKQV